VGTQAAAPSWAAERSAVLPAGQWSRNGDFPKWITTVDEEPGVYPGRRADALQHSVTGLRMPVIEGADPDGEHDVEGLFAVRQHEVFGRDVADTHAAGGDLLHRGCACLDDGGGGSVDGQDVAGGESGCDRPGSRSRSAS